MRARQRHLNQKDAGAALVLDARFLPLSNGSSCTSWTDRSGGGRTPTEATNPPIWFSAGLNGGPCVTFDGVNDRLLRGSADAVLKTLTRSVLILCRPDATMSGEKCQFNVGDTYALTQGGTAGRWWKDLPTTFTAPSLGTAYLFSVTDAGAGGASSAYINGGSLINLGAVALVLSPSSTGRFGVGSIASGGLFFKGDIGLIVQLPTALADPIRKRLERSAAFSFKIACS